MRAGFIDIGRRERKPAAVKAYAPPLPRMGKASGKPGYAVRTLSYPTVPYHFFCFFPSHCCFCRLPHWPHHVGGGWALPCGTCIMPCFLACLNRSPLVPL